MLCNYGCGKEARFQLKNGKWCCSKTHRSCKAITSNLSSIIRNIWKDQNSSYYSFSYKEKRSNIMKLHWSDPSSFYNSKEWKENRRKIMKNYQANYMNNLPKRGYKSHKEWMKNGGAVYISSFIKDDSKPESLLFFLVCKILPRPIHKFPIYRGKGKRNYTVDIGDPSLGILLEFDGWYHFDTKESIKRDKRRQKEIEEDGWKFIRYNIFQPFPTLEKIREDILEVLEKGK